MFNEINNKFIGKIYKTTQVMIVYNSLCKLKS